MKTSKEELRQLLARCEAAHELEKSRFARTLHDDLSQKLTALLIELSLLEGSFLPTTKEARKIGELSEIVSSISQSVRKMTNELRLKILDEFGLAAAIKHETERWKKNGGINFSISPELRELEMDAGLAAEIFKIFQRLTNEFVLQGVTEIRVRIDDTPELLSMRIAENAKGEVHQRIFAKEPLELLGLQEHARRLQGGLKLKHSSQGGTAVTLTVPKKAA